MKFKLVSATVTLCLYSVLCCKFPSFRNTSTIMLINKQQTKVISVSDCIKPSTDTRRVTNITITNSYVPVLFKEAVSNLPDLIILTIQKTQLSRVEDGAFLNLPAIKYLSLGNNELTTIKTTTFKGISPNALHLDYNRISTIERDAFSINGINLLQLSNNQLTTIESEWFGNSSLRYLFLDSNFITYIPANAFQNLKKLLSLSLRNNLIYGVHKDAFKGELKISSLHLGHNRLFSLETETFTPICDSLTFFYVDRNNLTYLPENFLDSMVKLKVLALEMNPWQCACYHKFRRITQERNIYVLPLVDPQGLYPACIQSLDNSEICVEAVNEEIIREYAKSVRG